MILEPCKKCGRPALISEGLGDSWQIGCFRDDCKQNPVQYQDGNRASRMAAITAWNSGKRYLGKDKR